MRELPGLLPYLVSLGQCNMWTKLGNPGTNIDAASMKPRRKRFQHEIVATTATRTRMYSQSQVRDGRCKVVRLMSCGCGLDVISLHSSYR